MTWFNFKSNRKLITLLRQSRQDFGFEKNQIKLSLMTSIKSKHLPQAENFKLTQTKPAFFSPRLAYVFASLILFLGLGSTAAFADLAKPGDRLFGLDQLQETIVLKIPLPEEAKAQIRADIVAERAAELTEINKISDHDELKFKAVESSQESLSNAIEQISEKRDALKKQGKQKGVRHLDLVLDRLTQLEKLHEVKAREIEQELKNPELKTRLNHRLEEIKTARTKAWTERVNNEDDKADETED